MSVDRGQAAMIFSFANGIASRKVCVGGLAEAPATLMWSTIIVFNQPGIEIGLQLVDRVIDLLAECDPVKLIQHSAMEALADSIIRHDDFGAPVFALP